MLVLSRKLNQSIIVGANVKIQVLKISGNTVRIGIEAPNDIKILRGELAPYEVDTETLGSAKQDSQSPEQDSQQPENLTIEFELDPDDPALLPNPFVVAQAS